MGIEGIKPALLAERLMKEYKIFTVAIDGGRTNEPTVAGVWSGHVVWFEGGGGGGAKAENNR